MKIFHGNRKWNWSPKPKIHFTIALTLCLMTAFLSIGSLFYAIHQITQNPIVEGVVVESTLGIDGKHAPIIEYDSPTEGRTRFKSTISTKPQRYFVGDTVEIVLVGEEFQPKHKSFFSIYGLSIFFFGFSIIAALGSLAIFRTQLKR
ncbi:DUF3592 domain-containing protein [Flagellimonas sp.]|uniref:DUF3592 domain-containing protein n=1 Tax=Flagellimonas sp. TaxID=2058762 RepID=UPI003BAA527D